MPIPKSMQSENSPKSSSSDGDLSSFSKTSGLCGYRGHNCHVDETALHEGTTAIIGTKRIPIISKFYEMRYKT